MKNFVIYWRDGKAQKVTGLDIADAFTRAGYGNGALRALDFYGNGDQIEYEWDATKREWMKLPNETR